MILCHGQKISGCGFFVCIDGKTLGFLKKLYTLALYFFI